MAIIRQIPWTEQPQTAAGVDWGNPLASGLVGLWTGRGVSYLGGALANGGLLLSQPTISGIGSKEVGSTGQVSLPSSVRDKLAATSQATALHLVIGTSTANQSAPVLYGSNADGDHYPYSGLIYLGSFTASRWINGVASKVPLTSPHTLVIQAKGGAQRATQNNLVLGTGSSAWSLRSSLIFNLSPGTGTTYEGTNVLSVVWDRYLTDTEVASLHANPWQLFAPRTQRIWTAASGGAYSITAQPGSYALSGQTSTITRSRLLTGSAGSYAVSGQNATVSRSRLITASAGAYAIAGQSATLVRSRLITAQAGAYTYTGQSATITYAGAGAYTLTALAGSYALTGQTATMTKSRVINAAAGSYALAGKAASITYSGAPAPTGLSGVYFDVLSGRLLVLRSGT